MRFTLREQPLEKNKEQTWNLEATIYINEETDKISYLKLDDKPYNKLKNKE